MDAISYEDLQNSFQLHHTQTIITTIPELQVFPEPICFNRETNGFEIVTSASKNIAKEIKALLRAAKRRDHIYDVTKLNSYTDLMLLPMEEEVLPDEKEVSTVFAVQVLAVLYWLLLLSIVRRC